MLMRQLLAGRHPGSLHVGQSQIEIKLYPEPPKKMPMSLNNEHLTRKPFDYITIVLIPWSSLAPILHVSFCFKQGEKVEGKTLSMWGICHVMDGFWGLPHIIPQEFIGNQASSGKTGTHANNCNVNYEGQQCKGKNKHLLSPYQV